MSIIPKELNIFIIFTVVLSFFVVGGCSNHSGGIKPDVIRAYVSNAGSNNVSVINTATNTVVDTVPVSDDPHGVAITPDGARVYVANFVSYSVSVI